jgi:hypothetical protein
MRNAIFVCQCCHHGYDPRYLITTLSREPFLAEQPNSCFWHLCREEWERGDIGFSWHALTISATALFIFPAEIHFLYIVSLSRCRLCDATTGTPHGTSFAYWRTGCRQLRDLVRRTLLLYLACLATYISTYCFRTVSALERVLRYTSYLHPCCLESTVNIVFAVSPSSCNVGGEGQNDASVKC